MILIKRFILIALLLPLQSFAPRDRMPCKLPITNPILELNYYNIDRYAKQIGIRFPDIMVKISRLETGHLKSRLCKQHNNLFAMRPPRKRATTGTGTTKSNYLTFDNWQKSVDDYLLFENQYRKLTRTQFLAVLRRFYSANGKYCLKYVKYL